jgi:hypothetical protein
MHLSGGISEKNMKSNPRKSNRFAYLGALLGALVAVVPSALQANSPKSEVCSPLSPQLCPGTTVSVGYGCNDGNGICCWVKDVLRNCNDGTQKSYTFRNRMDDAICDGTPDDGSGCISDSGSGGIGN